MPQTSSLKPQTSKLKAYLQLLHFGPSILTTAAFAAFICILARGLPDPLRLTLLLLAQLAAQFTISLANDYWDAPTDAQAQPTKPIPAGVIRRARVGQLAAAGVIVTLVLAVPLGGMVLLFTILGLGAGLAYDAGLKRTPASPLPFMLGFGVLPLWAAAGVGAPLLGPALPAALLTAVLVPALHLADTLPDLAGDQAVGLRGLAHILGQTSTLTACWAILTFGQAVALLLAIVYPVNWLLFAPIFAVAVALHLATVLLYHQRRAAALPALSGLLEAAALLTPLGWLAAAVL